MDRDADEDRTLLHGETSQYFRLIIRHLYADGQAFRPDMADLSPISTNQACTESKILPVVSRAKLSPWAGSQDTDGQVV